MGASLNILPKTTSAQQLYDRATAGGALGAWECNLANEALSWTDGVYDLFGLPRNAPIYRASILDLYHEQSRREMEQLRSAAIRTGQEFALDCRIRTAGGEDRWMRLLVGVGYQHGRPVRIFGSKQDVTAEKRMWDGVSTFARYDTLTGLATRRAFDDKLQVIAREHADGPGSFALVVFDIDHLRTINESFGRKAGDDCLRCLAARLGRLFPDALVVARSGEDEFALLLRVPGGQGHLAATLEGAHNLLSRPIPRERVSIPFSLSIGAAVLKPHHQQQREIFADAEAALRVARIAGRNCVRIFEAPFVANAVRLP
jgi:diguanylate cyclase (GGDEF)-like protein